ncbi:MAG TPA: hypothetical protein VHM88_20760, partial [Candidatus Acidoferrales bacterium]|nr:hypothetical protein [Candidatus Acidoferrales bacterium]
MSGNVVLTQFRLILVVAALSLFHTPVCAQLATTSGMPELPRMYVDTTYVPSAGRTIAVHAGGNFQAALNAAQAGDVITLEAGATFRGPFTLRDKPGSGWITIRTGAPDGNLPPPGTQIDPSYANVMPKLVAGSGSVIMTARGAHHYRFIGIEIRPSEGVFLYNLVGLGSDEWSVDQLPHHIIFDRCYLHGDPKNGTRRGIAMNSRYTAVIDSYLSDFKEVGADSQAIAGWNGLGPFKIVNNYLEAAGENILFGGADPWIPNLVPSDIEIRGNHFFKPLSWKRDEPDYAGTPWSVKNLFELKNARRVLVDGNVFEQNWVHAQNGFAILFTVRNQNGGAPWSAVEDVTFTNNIVRHTASAINLPGRDDNYPSEQTKRILIKNNLFEDVGGPRWGGGGRLFQVLYGTANVVIEHNTAFQTGPIIMSEGPPNAGFVFRYNITPHNTYGIIGASTGTGNPTLERYFPRAIVTKNVIIGGDGLRYPPGNFFPASLDHVG